MSQLTKKWIGSNQVDGSKIRLDNNQTLRGRNAADSADVDVLKVNSSDKIEFQSVPKVVGTPSASDDLATYGQVSAVDSASEKTANKGQPNGYASLDGSGKVPVAQLPSAIMEFKGSWDASTNTPALTDGTGDIGDVYRASVAGSPVGFTDPSMAQFFVGDFAIYNGTVWQRSPAADGVISVNGDQGAVTVNAINQLTGDVTAGPASGSQSKAATVAFVGGSAASDVHTAELAANAATDANTPSTIVKRDASGNFSAGTITANLTGHASQDVATSSLGNLTDSTAGADGITVTGGTGAVVGSVSIAQTQADATHNGYLSSTDWSTFNGKQAAGNYITALTGEVTASGPGSSSATVSNAAVIAKTLTGFSASPGTVTSSDSILTAIEKLAGNIGSSAAPKEDVFTLTGTDISNKYVDLSFTATNAASVMLTPVGGTLQLKGTDYSVSLSGGAGGVTRLSWSGLGLDGILSAGDILIVDYEA